MGEMTMKDRADAMTAAEATALANLVVAERLEAWHFTGEVTAKGRAVGEFVGERGPVTTFWFELSAAATAGRKRPL